jgi:hypothetical protein
MYRPSGMCPKTEEEFKVNSCGIISNFKEYVELHHYSPSTIFSVSLLRSSLIGPYFLQGLTRKSFYGLGVFSQDQSGSDRRRDWVAEVNFNALDFLPQKSFSAVMCCHLSII